MVQPSAARESYVAAIQRVADDGRAAASARRHRLPAADHRRAARAGVAAIPRRPARRGRNHVDRVDRAGGAAWTRADRAADCDSPAGAPARAHAGVSVAALPSRNPARRVPAAQRSRMRRCWRAASRSSRWRRWRWPDPSCRPQRAPRVMRRARRARWSRSTELTTALAATIARAHSPPPRSARPDVADALSDAIRWLDAAAAVGARDRYRRHLATRLDR